MGIVEGTRMRLVDPSQRARDAYLDKSCLGLQSNERILLPVLVVGSSAHSPMAGLNYFKCGTLFNYFEHTEFIGNKQ